MDVNWDFPGGTVVKNLPVKAGYARDTVLISGSGRSPGVENGNPLQYFCLENSMDRGPWHGPWGHKESDTTEHARLYKTAKNVKMRWMRDGGPGPPAQTPLPFS